MIIYFKNELMVKFRPPQPPPKTIVDPLKKLDVKENILSVIGI